MQNIESENVNNENEIPQHLSNTTSNNSSANTAKRTQNFSFASTYQPSSGQFIKSQQQNEFNSSNSKLSKTPFEVAYNFSQPIASFSVLNSDDFYTATSFAGSKPNAIVHPIRRYDQTNLPIGKQYGQQQQQQLQQQQENDTDSTHTSHSQPYRHQHSGSSVTQPPLSHPALNYTHNFAEELNRKLRYLHGSENHQPHIPSWTTTGNRHISVNVGKHAKSKNTTNSLTLIQRPLFITTVPTGVFLPPPKDMPLPPFLRPYVYSSHPMVLSDNNSSNYNKSPTFSKDKLGSSTAPIRTDDKDFTTTTTAAPSSLSSSSRINSSLKNHAQTLAGGVHITNEQFRQQIQQHRGKREVHREPYKNVMFDRRVVRGSNFSKLRLQPHYKNSELSAEENHYQTVRYTSSNGRSKRSTSSGDKQRNEVIQTDEDFLADDVIRKRVEISVNTQTELLIYPNDFIRTSIRNCVDVSTETSENELFFEQGIIDFFVDLCFEQSFIEMDYEVEIDNLKAKYKILQSRLSTESKDLHCTENIQDDTSAAKLLKGHIAKLVPEVLENLESAEYIEPAKKDEVMKTICPWLTVEVAEEVGHIVDSREILTVIIEEIIKQRAVAYGDVRNMPEIVANIEEIIEVPSENEQTGSN